MNDMNATPIATLRNTRQRGLPQVGTYDPNDIPTAELGEPADQGDLVSKLMAQVNQPGGNDGLAGGHDMPMPGQGLPPPMDPGMDPGLAMAAMMPPVKKGKKKKSRNYTEYIENNPFLSVVKTFFEDLKDPLLAILLCQIAASKQARHFLRDKAPFMHNPESGQLTAMGWMIRLVMILVAFYLIRHGLRKYFN